MERTRALLLGWGPATANATRYVEPKGNALGSRLVCAGQVRRLECLHRHGVHRLVTRSRQPPVVVGAKRSDWDGGRGCSFSGIRPDGLVINPESHRGAVRPDAAPSPIGVIFLVDAGLKMNHSAVG